MSDRRHLDITGRLRLFIAGLACCGAAEVGRAQFTETAATVAPGTWLFESDLLNAGWDDTGGDARYRYVSLGYVQFTRGATERLDLQAALQAHQHEVLEERGLVEGRNRSERWGDVALRGKWRIVGGEHTWQVSILPFVVIPLDRDDDGRRFAQLGLIVPFSRPLGADWWMDAQLQFDGSKSAGASREWDWLASANLQRTWNERWTGYIEVISDFTDGMNDAAVSGGLGLARSVGRGGWDVALYRGLTADAIDWELAVRLYWEI